MMSAPGTPAEMPTERTSRLSGHTCPECGEHFVLAHPRQIFCCTPHKRAWEKRSDRRGAQLLPFAVVARTTRGGGRGDKLKGLRAARDLDILIARWRDEDLAKKRMPIGAYLALRYRLGFMRP